MWLPCQGHQKQQCSIMALSIPPTCSNIVFCISVMNQKEPKSKKWNPLLCTPQLHFWVSDFLCSHTQQGRIQTQVQNVAWKHLLQTLSSTPCQDGHNLASNFSLMVFCISANVQVVNLSWKCGSLAKAIKNNNVQLWLCQYPQPVPTQSFAFLL